jgi:excinuclease ABC subunit A
VIRGRKGEYRKLFFDLRRQGFSRVRVNGALRELSEDIELDKNRKHTIEVVVDRLVVRDSLGSRLADSLETALRLADGVVQVEPVTGDRETPTAEPMVFSERLACAECGISLPEVSPRMFSFNSPYGACEACAGLGTRWEIDPERLVPNPDRSLRDGALAPWAGRESPYFKQTLAVLAKRYRFSLDTPWKDLKKSARDVILRGDRDGGFEGLVKVLERRYADVESDEARYELEPFMAERLCPKCGGSRLRPESLGIKIAGRSIGDVVRFTIKDAAVFFEALKLTEREATIARRVLKEIRERLGFLRDVGLEYLTLDRPAGTLSGGEGQRIRLATQIGSSLVGVLYILDEPSIGLHQRDNRRLLDTLKRLRDLGNTVLVVEHDEETIRSADFVIDLGPGAGELGGHLVAVGTPDEIMANPVSLTGRYLSRALTIPVRDERRKGHGVYLTIHNPREHNLRGTSVKIPLGTFTCVTGVSGSGKSTLVNDILYRALAQMLHRAQDRPGAHDRIEGARAYAALQSRHVHGRIRLHPDAVCPDAGRADAGLPAGAVLVQRQGWSLRSLSGRWARQDRDAFPARRLRDLRRVQGPPLQPRDARDPLQGPQHRRGPRHDRARGAGVLRRGARDQIEAADAARRRPRLHSPRPVGDDALRW